MRNAETPYMNRAFKNYDMRAFLLKCNYGHVARIPFSLWLASPARKHVIMLVNSEVPTSSYASESEDISREIGALRGACISLASILPKQAQRVPAPFIGVKCGKNGKSYSYVFVISTPL